MPIEDLTRAQSFALIKEMDSARNLLAYGERALRGAAFIETTQDPILTLLSIGVEKLLKLGLGLVRLRDTASWPSKTVMQNEFRHGTARMDSELRESLRSSIRGREYEPYIRGLLDAVEGDVIWPEILNCLDMYGRSGRFYNLDELGEAPQQWDAPAEYWTRIESAALADPSLREVYEDAISDGRQDVFDEFLRQLNNNIADSVHQWWEMIAVMGRHGALGETGKVFGFEVHPRAVGSQ